MIEGFFVCKQHEKATSFAAVTGIKLPEQHFILFDEGLQCTLSDLVRKLFDALEIFEDPFAVTFGQYFDRGFHRVHKSRGFGRPVNWLRKKDGPSAEISLQVRWLHAPQETWQAKAHGPAPAPQSRAHILCPRSLNHHQRVFRGSLQYPSVRASSVFFASCAGWENRCTGRAVSMAEP